MSVVITKVVMRGESSSIELIVVDLMVRRRDRGGYNDALNVDHANNDGNNDSDSDNNDAIDNDSRDSNVPESMKSNNEDQ